MCMLGNKLAELTISEADAIKGYRGWFIRREDNLLIPTNQKQDRAYSVGIVEAELDSNFPDGESGIYAFDSLDNNNNNNYNYYNYNNYSYNYNYNYSYNNYNYSYNNYNYRCYYVAGEILLFGRVIKHDLGYRASHVKVNKLILLTPRDVDKNFNMFTEHFNNEVKKTAKIYGVETINHVDWK